MGKGTQAAPAATPEVRAAMDLDDLHLLVCDTASLTTAVWRLLGCDDNGPDDPDSLERSDIVVLQTLICNIDQRMAKAIEGLDGLMADRKRRAAEVSHG